MNRRVSVKIIFLLILPLFAVSCVSNKTLASNAVSYNLAVERAQNRMLFLNVIRASDRLPMYLTDVSKVTGSIKSDVTASLAVPFGGTGAGKNIVTPGTTYSLNPTFDVNVLSTQEFMRGFLQPIIMKF